MSDKLLPIESVMEEIGVKRTKLYELIARGDFPHPIKIGASSRWPESDVIDYQERQKTQRAARNSWCRYAALHAAQPAIEARRLKAD